MKLVKISSCKGESIWVKSFVLINQSDKLPKYITIMNFLFRHMKSRKIITFKTNLQIFNKYTYIVIEITLIKN